MVLQLERRESVLVLHGWLSGLEVAEFARVAGDTRLPLRIDLSQLAGADASGIEALAAQRGRGARLTNVSPYIDLLLKDPGPAPGGEPSVRRQRRGRATGG